MKHAKLRSIIAFIGLACMAVFTPLLIAIFAFPHLAKGPLGWLALITGLLGIGICIAVRVMLKMDKKEKQTYLPDEEDADEASEKTDGKKSVKPETEPSESDSAEPEESDESEESDGKE